MARITVLNLMALVVIVALGLAAMRDASEWTERAAFTVTLFVMVAAVVGAIVRKGSPGFVGFAVFSWAYASIAFVPAVRDEFRQHLSTTSLVDDTARHLLGMPPKPSQGHHVILSDEKMIAYVAYQKRLLELGDRVENSNRIAHCMLALILGLLGAGVGRFLAAWPKRPSALPASGNGPATETSPTNP